MIFIERRIRKNKTRLAKNLRPEAVAPEVPEFEVAEEDVFHVVRTKRFDVKPMTVDEAILQRILYSPCPLPGYLLLQLQDLR